MRAVVVATALLAAAALAAAQDPDVGKTMTQICIARGYTSIEEHYVTTADGYILGMFRLPMGRPGTPGGQLKPGKPVVLLQHGLLDSSYTWVNNFANESLAFILGALRWPVGRVCLCVRVWWGAALRCVHPHPSVCVASAGPGARPATPTHTFTRDLQLVRVVCAHV